MVTGDEWNELSVEVDGREICRLKARDIALDIDSVENRETFTSHINRERIIVTTTDDELHISATLPGRRRIEREPL